jgi:hypothetical protein
MVTELEELKQSRNTPEETIQKISANGKFWYVKWIVRSDIFPVNYRTGTGQGGVSHSQNGRIKVATGHIFEIYGASAWRQSTVWVTEADVWNDGRDVGECHESFSVRSHFFQNTNWRDEREFFGKDMVLIMMSIVVVMMLKKCRDIKKLVND